MRSSPRDKAKTDAHLPTVVGLSTSSERQRNGTWPEEGVVVVIPTGCLEPRYYDQPCATKGHAGDEFRMLKSFLCA